MSYILCIETGTEVCSVSLSKDNRLIQVLESDAPQAHAKQLAVFIDDILKSNGLAARQLAAVAVSEGPGSYTGLRIGVSTAKGICFASNIPLIAIGSLATLAAGAAKVIEDKAGLICPMIDARRMEVYTAIYNAEGDLVSPVEAKVVDEHSFDSFLANEPVFFVGNGSAKCKDVIAHPNARFMDVRHSAENMVELAFAKLQASDFVDVAYYEPFYLKDFVVTKSKKNSLGL